MVKLNISTNKSKDDTTEARILAAARQEFIAYGLKGARMQAIADRGEVNKALLHYYFRSKQKLYEAAFADIVHTLKNAIEQELAAFKFQDNARSLLQGFITVYINTLRDNPDFPRFILRELADGGENMPQVISMIAPSVTGIPLRVNRILKKEIAAGNIAPVQPLHLMLNVLGMCIFTFIAQPILSAIDKEINVGLSFDDSFFSARINTILETVLNGISCKPTTEKKQI